MKPPVIFKWNPKDGYSQCIACGKWRQSVHIFRHEGTDWILCQLDYADYWENTDKLEDDYKWYHPPQKGRNVR